MSTLDYLKILATEKGISGREDNIREYMKKELEKYCDSIETDKFGNLIAKKRIYRSKNHDCITHGRNRAHG